MSEIVGTVLGEGRLNWRTFERVSDRYGSVGLWERGKEVVDHHYLGEILPIAPVVEGRGRLVAEVLEARQSSHVGDFFRGFFPETPEVGERIVLGEGLVFFDEGHVGLYPEPHRESDWLNPEMLYRAHDQDVRLIFEPT